MLKTPPEIADIVPEGYEPGSYDEMWDPEDGVRAHWHSFFRAIESMGSKELARAPPGRATTRKRRYVQRTRQPRWLAPPQGTRSHTPTTSGR